MKIYLAGPMTNIPYFNFPAFHNKAKELREDWKADVFSPAEHDIDRLGDFSKDYPTGDVIALARNVGFSLRDALHADLSFITKEADGIYMMKGWEKSSGARAEHATASALGLMMYYE